MEKPDFLSPSTVNSFVERRHSWYCQKILGHGFKSAHYFERGKAVEEGIRLHLEGMELDEAVSVANRMMSTAIKDMEMSDSDRDECAEYAMMMRDYIETGANALKMYGPLQDRKDPNWTRLGIRIEYKHPEVDIPFYGFLDFKYDKCVVDLKVKAKKPSKLDQGYIFQGIVYEWGTGSPCYFENLSHTKTRGVECTTLPLHKVNDLKKYERYLVASAKSLVAVYDAVNDGDVDKLLRIMSFPNLSAVWNPSEKDDLYEEFVSDLSWLQDDDSLYVLTEKGKEDFGQKSVGCPF